MMLPRKRMTKSNFNSSVSTRYELVIAEAAIGHDADLDTVRECLGQAHQDLVFIAVASVLRRRRLDRQPIQRRRPPVTGEHRQHERRLAVCLELGPVRVSA